MSVVTETGQDLKSLEKSAIKAVRAASDLGELEDIGCGCWAAAARSRR